MSLTLNIILSEIAAIGEVSCTIEGNPSFGRARMVVLGKPFEPDTLYVCSSPGEAEEVGKAGCCALLVVPQGSAVQSEDAVVRIATEKGNASVVFDELLDVFQRYDAWELNAERIIRSGGSVQDLLDASEPFLRNNVVVLDPALKLIGYTRNTACDDPITVELIEHGYHTEENIRKFKLHKRFARWAEDDGLIVNDSREICKYATVVKAFRTGASLSLICVMMCNREEPSGFLFDVFDLFTSKVEFFALRDYPVEKPAGNAVDSFVRALINDEFGDDDAVREHSQFVRIPYEARFCLFYMKTQKDSVPINRLVSDVTRIVAPAKTVLVDGAVMVLCYNCLNDACALHCMGQGCVRKGKTVSERLNEALKSFGLVCGRSSRFVELSRAPIAYSQARAAYEIGSQVQSGKGDWARANNWSQIYSFDLYSTDYLVQQLTPRQVEMLSATYAGAILSAIARHDAEAGTDNYEFLRSYLEHERRTSVVADKVHMHRNNVNYRVGRIEKQFNIDTDDPVLREDLLFAYRLRSSFIV